MEAQPLHSERFPQRIILNVTAAPANSMAVTWRTVQLNSTAASGKLLWQDDGWILQKKQGRSLHYATSMRTDKKELVWLLFSHNGIHYRQNTTYCLSGWQ